jgi:multidrug efflux pump subunit AcrA (membrane-fusion protein)
MDSSSSLLQQLRIDRDDVPHSGNGPQRGRWIGAAIIVARRQAMVSSKATGRVAEVLIEEGQRVEEDQVIARLDSSATSAELAQAAAAGPAGWRARKDVRPVGSSIEVMRTRRRP